jgi:hypothetical protein
MRRREYKCRCQNRRCAIRLEIMDREDNPCWVVAIVNSRPTKAVSERKVRTTCCIDRRQAVAIGKALLEWAENRT